MSGRYCIVNGRLRPADEPAVSPYDRNFSLGDGLFETLKVHGGKAVWLEEHLERMEKSAAFARINFVQKESCEELCELLIEKNGISGGFLRITLSRGRSPSGRFHDLPHDTELVITGGDTETGGGSISAGFAPWPVNENDPASFHKTTSRFSNVLAKLEAERLGVDDLLFVNTKGELTESIFSNVFWAVDGGLFTPAVECGLLAGITRAKVIHIAGRLGLTVNRGRFGRDALGDADEIFFTNSTGGVRPCHALDGNEIKTGEITRSLEKEIARLMEK
jgi:branched-subunit amino acid aminotransferase/4-amino-4-deoxychorismate lyase